MHSAVASPGSAVVSVGSGAEGSVGSAVVSVESVGLGVVGLVVGSVEVSAALVALVGGSVGSAGDSEVLAAEESSAAEGSAAEGSASVPSRWIELDKLNDLKFSIAAGKEVPKENALKRLAKGGVVVISADGQKIAPAFLKVFKDDQLILTSSDLVIHRLKVGGAAAPPPAADSKPAPIK